MATGAMCTTTAQKLEVAAGAWNQLFLVVDSLPGTVPPTVVMLVFEAWHRWARPPLAERAV
jgi:hypothetical protein